MFSDNDQTLLIGEAKSGDQFDVFVANIDEKATASHSSRTDGKRTASLALDVGASTICLYDKDLMALTESGRGGKGGWRVFAPGPSTTLDIL